MRKWHNGAVYDFGFVPAGPSGCTATDSLSGFQSCSVGGYSGAVGAHTIVGTAVDKAGNLGYGYLQYTVNAWTLSGFFPPVDMRIPANPNIWNTIKGGSTVPLKFEVFAGSTELTSVSVVDFFIASTINCTTSGTEDPIEFTTTGGTSLRYDSTSGQFIQNWQTPKAGGKCYAVTMATDDGSSLVAYFKTR